MVRPATPQGFIGGPIMNGDCVSAGPVAISVLRDQSNNYVGEDFEGLAITKFDGTTITV